MDVEAVAMIERSPEERWTGATAIPVGFERLFRGEYERVVRVAYRVVGDRNDRPWRRRVGNPDRFTGPARPGGGRSRLGPQLHQRGATGQVQEGRRCQTGKDSGFVTHDTPLPADPTLDEGRPSSLPLLLSA